MKFKYLLLILLTSAATGTSLAGGSEFNSFFGARSTSLNGLYFAGIDGLASAINNPAGLAYLNENSFEFSIIDQLGRNNFNSGDTMHYVSYRNDDFSFGGGFSYKINSNLSAGITYAPVADYRVEWPYLTMRNNDTVNVILSFGLFNRIQINSITPTAAVRFGSFAAGLSMNIYLVNFDAAFPLDNNKWIPGQNLAAYQFEYNLSGWGYGFTLGLLNEFSENLRVGLMIKSGFSTSLKGDGTSRMFSDLDSTAQKVNTTTDLKMPWLIGGGIIYSIRPDLKLNIDAQYSLWGSTSSKLDFSFDNAIWQNNLNKTDPNNGINGGRFNFSNGNSLRAGIGLEYFASEDLVVRVGYRYTKTPNSDINYNFLFPDVSSYTLSTGLGLIEGNYALDISVMYTKGIETGISNGAGSTGKYNLDNIVPVITGRYKF